MQLLRKTYCRSVASGWWNIVERVAPRRSSPSAEVVLTRVRVIDIIEVMSVVIIKLCDLPPGFFPPSVAPPAGIPQVPEFLELILQLLFYP